LHMQGARFYILGNEGTVFKAYTRLIKMLSSRTQNTLWQVLVQWKQDHK
jgi:hypothetical protein